jgi:hypothetical protein
LFDRLWRERPLISLVKDLDGNLALRVRNLGRYDIVLGQVAIKPRVYAIAQTREVRALVEAASGFAFDRWVPAGKETLLHIVPLAKDGRRADEQPCTVIFLIFWRRTRSMWFKQFPLWLRVKTEDFRSLAQATE